MGTYLLIFDDKRCPRCSTIMSLETYKSSGKDVNKNFFCRRCRTSYPISYTEKFEPLPSYDGKIDNFLNNFGK